MNELVLLPLLMGKVTFWVVRLNQISPAFQVFEGIEGKYRVCGFLVTTLEMISCSVVCLRNLNIWS